MEADDCDRGLASYAYFAKDYYKTYFANEPDPFDDFVEPKLNEIDAARAAAAGTDIFTVTFEPNGGGGDEMPPQMFVSGAPQTLSANIWEPPFPGETFLGWALTWDGDVIYTDRALVTIGENRTLYAIWSGSSGGGGGEDTPDPVNPDPVNPDYEVIEEKDITAPYEAPKAVTIMGVVYDGNGAVAGVLELKLGKVNAKKGTSKINGTVTTLDGKKHTIKAYTVSEIDGNSPMAVSLSVKDLGTMDVTIGGDKFAGSLGGMYHVQSAAVGGAWAGSSAKATVEIEDGDLDLFPGTLLTALLPDEEQATVKNGKWTFAKAASVKWAKPKKGAAIPEIYDEASGKGLIIDDTKGKTNLSGLKLTYTPKKGTFMGSFKVYALQGEGKATKLKSYTISVNGMVVDGVGAGMATCKKPAVAWPVTVR